MSLKQKIILDVDTGSDDAVAILMAGYAASLELMAVTVTHGNGPLELTLRNTLMVVEAGRLAHVPVLAGASRPLVRDPYPTKSQQRAELPHCPPVGCFAGDRSNAIQIKPGACMGNNLRVVICGHYYSPIGMIAVVMGVDDGLSRFGGNFINFFFTLFVTHYLSQDCP